MNTIVTLHPTENWLVIQQGDKIAHIVISNAMSPDVMLTLAKQEKYEFYPAPSDTGWAVRIAE